MPVAIVKDHEPFLYLTDTQGEVADFEEISFTITDADRAKIDELKPKMFEDITLVVREEETGAYGLVLEGTETPAEGHEGYLDDGRFDGRIINGKLLSGNELPSFGEAVAHVAAHAEQLNEMFPGLNAEVHFGTSTFNGHATLRAFIPEESPLVDKVPDIGAAMYAIWDTEMATTPTP